MLLAKVFFGSRETLILEVQVGRFGHYMLPFLFDGESVGPNTGITVKAIMSSHKVEQQGYKSCMALLKLADKYSLPRLEAACTKVLSYTPNTWLQKHQDHPCDRSG